MTNKKMKKNALPITREEDFNAWYQEVIKGADLAEMSGVRGCMVIKPWGYAIWERIQRLLDDRIKETGHDNVYFPLFIPLDLFKKEAEHVEGFAKEMAIITHTRLEDKGGELGLGGELETPLVVRPTSETIIGEAFAKWINSYRDLPVKLNQWANVVRWEMRTRMFLRTSEFLWQEGHTAHADRAEAEAETLEMLEVYRNLVEDKMCIPLHVGKKSPSERFPGAVDTYTIEAMMQDGKSLQSGTSHYLGQGFAKAANITYQDENGEMQLVHTTSWGVSTRMIGGLIMTHSDDDGLRLPPQIAPQQVIILPILKGGEQDEAVLAYCEKLKSALSEHHFAGEKIRTRIYDTRGKQAVRWDWVRKGAPVLVEIGPKDLEKGAVAVMRRDDVHGKKQFPAFDDFVSGITDLLTDYEASLIADAKAYNDANIRSDIQDFDALKAYFSSDERTGFVRAKWCEDPDSEAILDALGVKIRCLLMDQSGTAGHCVLTGKPATTDIIIARAY